MRASETEQQEGYLRGLGLSGNTPDMTVDSVSGKEDSQEEVIRDNSPSPHRSLGERSLQSLYLRGRGKTKKKCNSRDLLRAPRPKTQGIFTGAAAQ